MSISRTRPSDKRTVAERSLSCSVNTLDLKERLKIETRQCLSAHLVDQTIECVACHGRQGICGSEKTCSQYHLLNLKKYVLNITSSHQNVTR